MRLERKIAMPWVLVCGSIVLGTNHDERKEQEDHQLATACLFVSDAEARYCAFCGLASGKVIEVKFCVDLDHARNLGETRQLLER